MAASRPPPRRGRSCDGGLATTGAGPPHASRPARPAGEPLTPRPPFLPPPQAGPAGPRRPGPVPAGSARAGGGSPCARAARCPLTSGACWRAGGRRRGSSRYVRVVLRLLGLRLQRAGGARRPGRGGAARHRALGHASCLPLPPPPLPPRRPLLFTLRGPHGGRRAQAPPPPLPPRCAGRGGTCSPAARARSANPGRGGRRLPAGGNYNSQRRLAAARPALPAARGATGLVVGGAARQGAPRRRGGSAPAAKRHGRALRRGTARVWGRTEPRGQHEPSRRAGKRVGEAGPGGL